MTRNKIEVCGGTAVHIGQIIEPARAIELGRLGQRFPGRRPGQDGLGVPSRRVSIEHVAETEEQLELMTGVGVFLDRLLEFGGQSVEASELDILIGAAARGEWHIDRIRDSRLLVNISEFPVYLDVATEWEGRQWAESWGHDDPPYPLDHERISYDPGEAVLLDNACSPVEQVPHRGSTQPGKIILRAFCSEILIS